MSIQLITIFAWSGVLTSSLIYSLISNNKLGRFARPASFINIALAVTALIVTMVSGAPVAVVATLAWLFTGFRTYPYWFATSINPVSDPMTPLYVSSAAANSWSSVAGQGNSVGYGSMVRLVS